jgi:hypothetical protein
MPPVSKTRAERSRVRNWDDMSLVALWNLLNDPKRHPTPQSTVEAIMYCVRERGLGALKEPSNIERLYRCDDRAKEEILRRIVALGIDS